MNRKQWNTGVISIVLMILCIAGLVIVLNALRDRQGSVGHRDPLPGFGYCSSQQIRPCILSINLNPDGSMLINVLANGSSQDFYIKIRHAEGQHIYECKKAKEYSIHVSCTGEAMPVGETLSFLVISKKENTTLAEGSFPVIGMALATPEVYLTPTPLIFDHSPR